jgi:hypothetical protein
MDSPNLSYISKFKYVNVSQHWSSKRGKEYQGKYQYVNPLTDEGKNKLASINDFLTLHEFHQWREGIHYSFSNMPDAVFGCELYEIDGNNLKFIKASYDTSD